MAGNKKDKAFRTFDFSNTVRDPVNRIHSATLIKGKPSKINSVDIAAAAFHAQANQPKSAHEEGPLPEPPEKIHPLLAQWLADRPGGDREEIIVVFDDDLKIPRFPEPAAEEPRAHPANRLALRKSEALINAIDIQRAPGYAALTADLVNQYGASVLDQYWLTKAMLVEMPLSSVKALAARDDVLYVEPRYGGSEPPVGVVVHNAIANDDVIVGRTLIGSDPYYELGLSGGFAALLDTGVRSTHQLISSANLDFMGDCVDGGKQCDNRMAALFNVDDIDVLGNGHGTKSAGILVGSNNGGANSRGVTSVTLHSFRVYKLVGNGPLSTSDTHAAKRAFEKAIALGAFVILVEIQDHVHSATSSVCKAADRAFDAGAVVIATNGNFGNGGTNPRSVRGPALAHKVIGVGSFDIATRVQDPDQSLGPAPDGRIKPDLQGPTGAETAGNQSDTMLDTHGGTSGAAPFVAGAAVLVRNFLAGTSGSIDPGQVYAFLILSGQHPYKLPNQPPGFDNTIGAGPLLLPNTGLALWGKVELQPGLSCDVPIDVSNLQGGNMFDGALWWPEEAKQVHNDIDLEIIDPAGVVQAFSTSTFGVFERARFQGVVVNGQWKLRILAQDVTTAQTVYWAAFVHGQPGPQG